MRTSRDLPHAPYLMSSSRPKLMLDEQSFQDMLAAAYVIQEHNAKRKRALRHETRCGKCGASIPEGESLCAECSADEVRPGEKLQQKWASMWLLSQEQSLSPETSPGTKDDFAPSGHIEHLTLHTSEDDPVPQAAVEVAGDEPQEEEVRIPVAAWTESSLDPETLDSASAEAAEEERELELTRATGVPALTRAGLAELRLKLRFHRADLYLVVAIIVSTFAMLWVLLATPAVGVQSRLRPWERALVSVGLADAPDPPARHGNPAVMVWVDPKTALYYCYGEEQYGTTPGGRSISQREAQLDSFQPAGRIVCD